MSSVIMAGKVAIVTGASSGIGKAIAVNFAEKNCKLTITGRNMKGLLDCKALCKEKGADERNLRIVVADMKNEEEIDEIFKQTIDAFGKIDYLISNHGMLTFKDDMASYHEVLQVNLHSHVYLTRLCTEELMKSGGVIIYVSSTVGLHPVPTMPYYAMTKAALDYYMRCTALNLADKGVRVYSINPGITRTEIFVRSGLNDELAEKTIKSSGDTFHALNRHAEPSEMATVAAFLVSDKATHTTGARVPVDGGADKLFLPFGVADAFQQKINQ